VRTKLESVPCELLPQHVARVERSGDAMDRDAHGRLAVVTLPKRRSRTAIFRRLSRMQINRTISRNVEYAVAQNVRTAATPRSASSCLSAAHADGV
jgi:hypothetical protein